MRRDGVLLGNDDNEGDCERVGLRDGVVVGTNEGAKEDEGTKLGVVEGAEDGGTLGVYDGDWEGLVVGRVDGRFVDGLMDGSIVGFVLDTTQLGVWLGLVVDKGIVEDSSLRQGGTMVVQVTTWSSHSQF